MTFGLLLSLSRRAALVAAVLAAGCATVADPDVTRTVAARGGSSPAEPAEPAERTEPAVSAVAPVTLEVAPLGPAPLGPAPLGPAPIEPGTLASPPSSGAAPVAPSRALRDAPALTREQAGRQAAAGTRSVWDRIRAGFAMPELRSPIVEQRVRWYTARPDLLGRMFERGAPYLHFIVEEVSRRGLPTELALLPFVESAMDPSATSVAAAAGLWQFIPATGRRFDLSQDWWIDERRDVVASTRAALDYLQAVHEMHGRDWFLALASYNWGENAVARAVRANRARGRPAGYEHLRMPEETRHYVPKLLALRRIVRDAAALGIALPAIPDAPYFATIEHPVPMDLKLAASFAGMPLEDFVALNPAHNRPVIAASRNAEIRLPVDRVARFRAAYERHAAQRRPFVTWKPHTLRHGETVESLAADTGASVAEIRRANGLPAGGRRLRAGSRILVPAGPVADASYVESFDAPRLLWHPPPSRSRAAVRRAPSSRATGARDAATHRAVGSRGATATVRGARVRGKAARSEGVRAPRIVPAARPSAKPAAPARARPTVRRR
jgi:membrane-bound lytic murein transglycosylase D